MKLKWIASVIMLLALAGFSRGLMSQEAVDDTQDVPRGFYVGMSTGQIYFLNQNDRRVFEDAWVVGLRAGYDLIKYLSIEGQFRFSGHDTSTQGQSGVPNSFLAYQGLGFLIGNYPVTRRLTLFANAGGGLWYTNPNQKEIVGTAYRGMFTAGLGLQYFLKVKGLAMGLDPSLSIIKDLQGAVLQATGYLRYTF